MPIVNLSSSCRPPAGVRKPLPAPAPACKPAEFKKRRNPLALWTLEDIIAIKQRYRSLMYNYNVLQVGLHIDVLNDMGPKVIGLAYSALIRGK